MIQVHVRATAWRFKSSLRHHTNFIRLPRPIWYWRPLYFSVNTGKTLERVTDRAAILESLPKGIKMAELGVFEGVFSREMLRICEPSELHLIDLWKSSRSPDASHMTIKRLKRFGMWRTFRRIKREHRGDPRVQIHRGFTTEVLARFPDDHLDFVYVDASHKYENVKADLELSRVKVRNGGFICGHDYQFFVGGEDSLRYVGLRRAVDEFCEENGLSIATLTLPGSTITDNSLSYCIVNRK